MSRWKRSLIWLATFAFGLLWVLAFLLPTEVGGGIDRHGMYAPDLVGTRLYYTTGVRAAPQPLAEHDQGAFIVSMDVRDTAVRTPAFSSSITRRDDYNGAKRPQVWKDDSGFHMLYIGLGMDDKRRVCQADSQDGIHFTPQAKAVLEVPNEISTEGPVYIALSSDPRALDFIVMNKGLGILHSAYNRNGVWRASAVQESYPNESTLSCSGKPGITGGVSLVKKGDGPVILADHVINGLTSPVEYKQIFHTRTDVKLSRDAGTCRLMEIGGDSAKDPGLKIALLEGPAWNKLRLASGSQPDGSIAAPGSPARKTYANDWTGKMADFVPIVSAFGFGMGLISLLGVHGRRLRKGGEMAFYSGIVVVAMLTMLVVQLRFAGEGKPETGVWHDLNDILFYRLQFPLTSTTFGLLAAYLVSAAYRAFRIRTLDAAVLAAMAAFVILTQVPTGQFLASLFAPGMVDSGAHLDAQAVEGRNWALTIANDAVQRAVGFGAFVGAIAMAMRVWLSLDRTAGE